MLHFLIRKFKRHDDPKLQAALEELREYVVSAVAATFDPPDEILQVAIEVANDRYNDAAALQPHAERILKQAAKDHLAKEATWPQATDCDRLDQAFAQLEQHGVVCRQHFSCCGTCAAGEIWNEIEKEEREGGREIRGCVHYNIQDTESAVQGSGIYSSYGSVEEGTQNSEAIGHEIVAALENHGFDVSWNGCLSQRIFVSVDWKRRLPPRLAALALRVRICRPGEERIG